MNTPDVLVMFPQPEPEAWSKCISCSEVIYEKQDQVVAAGYDYCDTDCYLELALEEGTIAKVVAGE